jgi:O-antigen ligase
MMPEPAKALPLWFPYVDLALVAVAGGVWYAFPQAGAWPLILALAPWAGRYLQVRRLTRRTPFDLPLAIFVLTAGLGVWAAYDRQAAWPKFWLIVGGVLLFYALVNAEPIGAARVWFLALFGAAVAVYFLATDDWDAYPAKIDAFTRLGRALQAPLPVLPGHRLNPNVAGGIMAMMLPFSGWVTVQTWRVRRPWTPARGLASIASAASLASLALTAFGLLLTTSRGAWLALAAALLLTGLWFASGLLSRGSSEGRTWVFPALLALMLAAALAVGIAWPGGIPGLISAIAGPNTGLDRMQLLRNTFNLVRDYPIVGAGLGGFQMLYSTYVLLIHVGYAVHSHNLYLHVAVEQGLPALLALVWMGLLFAAAVLRGLFRSSSRLGSAALGAAALSLVILLFHGLVDDVPYGSRAVLLLFVPLAFAVPSPQPRPLPARRRAVGLVPIALLLLMAAALIWQRPLLSLGYSNLGAVHQSQAELSVYSWPEWPIQDAVRRAIDLRQPMSEFERALDLDPANATANRRLGMIELSLGEYEDALQHLEAAASAEPASETTRQLLGEALLVNGRLAEGKALWATVGNEQGQLAARTFWYQHIGDAERAAWVQQAATRP